MSLVKFYSSPYTTKESPISKLILIKSIIFYISMVSVNYYPFESFILSLLFLLKIYSFKERSVITCKDKRKCSLLTLKNWI